MDLAGRADLVLLDRGLPDGDGIDLCRRLLDADPGLRVLVLTARTDEIDVVLGLDAGATDYVAKPFRLGEVLVVGDLRVDPAARRVHVRGAEVDLRPREFDLLVRLASEPGVVVRRETLMSDVWDDHWFGSTKTLDVHVAALRRRIDDPAGPSRITTVRGVGYRLEPAP